MRIAVIDSSPLIHLTHLDLCRELVLFFDVVYIPRAVHREVNRKARFRHRLRKLYKTGRFVRCTAADVINVRLLLADVDEGEAEALVQAREKSATFFVGDEKPAREIGEKLGLKCVGTIRLLARLGREGRAAEPRSLVHKLQRDLGFRVTEEVLDQAIAMSAEPI